jgi:mono/diheme cytochrome c family protein
MRYTSIRLFATALFLFAVSGVRPVQAQSRQTQTKAAAAGAGGEASSQIARGKYIVDGLARCTRCHTPLLDNGQRDEAHYLMGAPVVIRPTYNSPNWALRAPRLAGAPPATDEQFVRLMTTGIAPTGTYLNPPMPQFRMTRSDAEAVLAYLKSLTR